MKLTYVNFAIATALALSISACNKNNDNNNDNPGTGRSAGSPAPTPTPDPAHAAQLAGLQGTWSTDCNHDGVSTRAALGIDNQTYRQTVSTFIGGVCTSSPDAVLIDEGTFSVGSELSSGSGEFPLDQMATKVTIIPETVAGAAALNAASLCGKTDWAAGASTDVTAQVNAGSCSGYRTKSYFAYQLRNSNHTLRVAQPTSSQDASSPEKRPTDFSHFVDYMK